MTFAIASSPALLIFRQGLGTWLHLLGIDFEEEEKGVKVSSSLVPANLTVFAPG